MSTHSNVIALPQHHAVRQVRGAFVKQLMDEDGRSARYMAAHVGISNTAFSDRLKGKAPFLADELETIASVLKINPVEFYNRYIHATDHPEQDSDRRTLVPKVAGSTPVGGTLIPFPTRGRNSEPASGGRVAPIIPIRSTVRTPFDVGA